MKKRISCGAKTFLVDLLLFLPLVLVTKSIFDNKGAFDKASK